MKLLAIVFTMLFAVLGVLSVIGTASAQDDGVIITLTKAIEGVDPDPAGTDFAFSAPSLGGDVTLKPGYSWEIATTPTATVTFTELDQPAGWEFVSASCVGTTDVTIDGSMLQATAQGNDVTCTFTSRPVSAAPVNLTITKSVLGDDPLDGGTAFQFTRSTDNTLNTLRDGESFSVAYAPPLITITEIPKVGWTVVDFTCEGAYDIVSSALLQAHIIVAEPGATVSCTYVNSPQTFATVTVIKKVAGENPDDPSFDFSVNSGLQNFDLADGQAVNVLLNGGTYTISEEPREGWQTPVITCSDHAPVTAFEISLELTDGETTCTFLNRPVFVELLGDVTCDGALTIIDAYAAAQYAVNLRTGESGCPLTDPTAQINIDAVTVDGNPVTVATAYLLARCAVKLPNHLCPAPPA